MVYFAVDFANPLMPGAVWFEDGSVQIVEADRTRTTDHVEWIDVLPTPDWVVDRPDEAQTFGCVKPTINRQKRAVMHVRRVPASPPDPAAPSEDH